MKKSELGKWKLENNSLGRNKLRSISREMKWKEWAELSKLTGFEAQLGLKVETWTLTPLKFKWKLVSWDCESSTEYLTNSESDSEFPIRLFPTSHSTSRRERKEDRTSKFEVQVPASTVQIEDGELENELQSAL